MPQEDCIEWPGSRLSSGYGYFRIRRDAEDGGRIILAHRYIYELVHGPLADGEVVRHKVCDNPPCVNLAHLEAGTQADNIQDMVDHGRGAFGTFQSAKTHCPQNHEYTEENTYRPPGRPNQRMCKQCTRDRARERYRTAHPDVKKRV